MAKWVDRIVFGYRRVAGHGPPKAHIERFALRRNRELDLLHGSPIGNRALFPGNYRNSPCKLDMFRFELPMSRLNLTVRL